MKKLLNKKGSVLFLVVVVMSLLIIAASATYYVVSSQRSSVEVHYATEQSYQTALSVSETVEDYFTALNGKITSGQLKYEDTLFKKMMEMQPGKDHALTSDSNDLAQYGLGNFDLTIVKSDKSTDKEGIFDITTKAVTNGETTTLTQVWKIEFEQTETTYFTRFLTSTGKGRPEDCYVVALQIFGEAYFENEFTKMSKPTAVNRNLYSTGTWVDDGVNFSNAENADIIVAENVYMETTENGDMHLNRLFVGGNLLDSQKSITAKAAYILGDMTFTRKGSAATTYFVRNDCYIGHSLGNGAVAYIGGDLHLLNKGEHGLSNEQFYVKGNVYDDSPNGALSNIVECGGTIYRNGVPLEESKQLHSSGVENTILSKMQEISEATQDDDKSTADVFSSWNAVETFIDNSTVRGNYKSWNAEKLFTEPGAIYYDAPTIDIDSAITYLDSSIPGAYVDLTDTGRGSKVESPDNYHFVATIAESCRLYPFTKARGYGDNIVIDASKEDIYIYLDPNGGDTFSFFGSNSGCHVYVKGEYAVIFVLPDNITFKGGNQQFVGHYDIAHKIKDLKEPFTGIENNYCYDITNETDFNNKLGEGVLKTETKVKTASDGSVMKDADGNDITYKVSYLDESKFGDNGNKVHNNIFLVANGTNNTWDLDAAFTLCGYIYAPKTYINLKRSGGGCMQFYGGLIVGSYEYSNESAFLGFVEPYDPYTTIPERYGNNIVSYLISQADDGFIEDEDGDDEDQQSRTKATLLGYK